MVLREHARALIADCIDDRTYRLAERLVETKIAEELRTSQSPVRQALRDLEFLRDVASAPSSGRRFSTLAVAAAETTCPSRRVSRFTLSCGGAEAHREIA